MPSRSKSATYARRRQRRMAKVDHDLTPLQWEALQAAWAGCAYCGAAGGTGTGHGLQRDCMLPISRGGRYTLDNVVPACASCNASKCNSELTVWMRRKKLDEREFWARKVEITRALTPEPVAPEPGAPHPPESA